MIIYISKCMINILYAVWKLKHACLTIHAKYTHRTLYTYTYCTFFCTPYPGCTWFTYCQFVSGKEKQRDKYISVFTTPSRFAGRYMAQKQTTNTIFVQNSLFFGFCFHNLTSNNKTCHFWSARPLHNTAFALLHQRWSATFSADGVEQILF